jgi:hypothetical protein
MNSVTPTRDANYLGWVLKGKGLSRQKVDLLLGLRDELRVAWERDDKGTKGFPINTGSLLVGYAAELKGVRSRSRKPSSRKHRSIEYPKVPTRLLDILPEKHVRQIHEYLHEEPFQDALDEMRSPETIEKALVRIRETLEIALYFGPYGEDALPKPRGNWLHRQILSFIQASMLPRFTDSELAKLFDYLCPCGLSHNREAMKKFRWRQSLLQE